ncbi:MAG: bifunctional (p)ppGpp synthetase/guanosine-3',5'-bis(diphosphate) 3'-pyrophosphohydrolase [Candidatus Thioglobus sp.]|jgi:guanosine-3',5'-bis(diphosphate) 3'-pyrophosphohydrolase|nr:bifunctional (p)ppGpp synthetase/guanosine-3',5'-bis(diphosphate) 3'-pyrophosphohydrolase [Candidatus Pseudothioglobus aerophilus]MBT4244423.1 bifunctional (p)ppGpp synthetase/guanosine-3',5'-bis(diphosphate) 3'-pyrophosphohydrolase [Gammaproteobacteria bacterium]
MATTLFQKHTKIDDLCLVLNSYLPHSEVELVKLAYRMANKAHSGQFRKSGEPYIHHPLSVALILADLKLDYFCIVAAILHDCIEDTAITKEDVQAQFGEQVAHIVEGVSKLTSLEFTSSSQKQAENFQKLILAMSKDMRVMVIKLADRLHNMRTLDSMSDEKKLQKAKETYELHAPIARRLGLHSIRVELDDLCFKTLHPRKHLIIKKKISKQYGNQKKTINLIKTEIENRLKFEGISASIEGRQKQPSSVYNKMKFKSRKFSEVLDMHAFRIVVENTNTCYQVLGHIHSLYKPIPLKFKDYISAPKPNGYQSIHTVVLGPRKMFIEVQIRSQEMEFISEYGIAAHWHYKNTDKPTDKLARNWIGSLLDIQQNTDTSADFLENTKADLFFDEVFVFTPAGKIIQLPLRATVLDFAYAVHTNIGKRAQKATINGVEAELSTELKSGQTVEIITSRFVKPKPSWLDFVVTSKAKTSIKANLKDNSKTELARLGKLLISDALKYQKIKINDVPIDKWNKCLKELNCFDFQDLYIKVGLSEIFVAVVINKLLQDINNETINTISISKTKGMAINFAHCCYPIPGDEVTGVLTRQKGLVMHRSICSNLEHIKEKNAQWMEIEWSSDEDELFEVAISALVENRSGRLAAIANTIANLGVNIENIEQKESQNSTRLFHIVVIIKNIVQLNDVLEKLNKLPHLVSAERV